MAEAGAFPISSPITRYCFDTRDNGAALPTIKDSTFLISTQ